MDSEHLKSPNTCIFILFSISSSYCESYRDDDKQSSIGQYLIINKVSEMELGTYKIVATRMDTGYEGKSSSYIINIQGEFLKGQWWAHYCPDRTRSFWPLYIWQK